MKFTISAVRDARQIFRRTPKSMLRDIKKLMFEKIFKTELKMKKLEPYPIASALFFIFTVLYLVCIGVELLLSSMGITGFWHMHKIWEVILPWFSGLDSLSIVIGLLEVSLGSYLSGYIIVPVYNYLIRNKVKAHKLEIKPIIIRFKTLFLTFAAYVSILFTLCLVYDLIVPPDYQMLSLWKTLLPGFTG